jgi:hypothetical protein
MPKPGRAEQSLFLLSGLSTTGSLPDPASCGQLAQIWPVRSCRRRTATLHYCSWSAPARPESGLLLDLKAPHVLAVAVSGEAPRARGEPTSRMWLRCVSRQNRPSPFVDEALAQQAADSNDGCEGWHGEAPFWWN